MNLVRAIALSVSIVTLGGVAKAQTTSNLIFDSQFFVDIYGQAASNSGTWVGAYVETSPGIPRLRIIRTNTTSGCWNVATHLWVSPAHGVKNEWMDIETDHNGTWIIVWAEQDGSDQDPMYTRSTDDGLTWSSPSYVFPDHATDNRLEYDPRIATDGSGNWVLTAWGSTPSSGFVYGANSSNNGMSFGSPIFIATGDTVIYPDVASDGTNFCITYVEDELYQPGCDGTTPDRREIYVQCFEGLVDSTPAIDYWNASSMNQQMQPIHNSPEIAATTEGDWVILWNDECSAPYIAQVMGSSGGSTPAWGIRQNTNLQGNFAVVQGIKGGQNTTCAKFAVSWNDPNGNTRLGYYNEDTASWAPTATASTHTQSNVSVQYDMGSGRITMTNFWFDPAGWTFNPCNSTYSLGDLWWLANRVGPKCLDSGS